MSTLCLRPALAFAGAHAFASGTHAPGCCIARVRAHTYAQQWWGGKGARWVNRAKRWVAISEFLVGKHRHDGPWSRLRSQSCIGDSIGEGGRERRGEEIVSRRLFKQAPRIFREPSYSTTKRLPNIYTCTRFSASLPPPSSALSFDECVLFRPNKRITLRERFLDVMRIFSGWISRIMSRYWLVVVGTLNLLSNFKDLSSVIMFPV